jgi:HD superfamily phosphohydrolase
MPNDVHRIYEIRCPVYGFIKVNDLEWQIISHPAFQRLRRIRQLAWTDYVFPGAMHTRFEHSLGVMNMASMLFDGIVERSFETLRSELGYTESGLQRHKALVRVTALLHDIGHSPFSHAGEELFPFRDKKRGERFKHEHYSAEIIRRHFASIIENHPLNSSNWDFSANDVANLLEGRPEAGNALFWRGLISGQLDADRMDYLLRDSLHAGVGYGRYDWKRLANTTVAIPASPQLGGTRIGVLEGGWHAAEGLIIARYFMFTQVYFHKTRVVYDHHLQHALAKLLPGGSFPEPKGSAIDRYLEWDDWRVLGLLSERKGGEHADRLARRNHYREILHTSEAPKPEEIEKLKKWRKKLGNLIACEIPAAANWYKTGPVDILVMSGGPKTETRPLSQFSSVVATIPPAAQVRLYAKDAKNRNAALARL